MKREEVFPSIFALTVETNFWFHCHNRLMLQSSESTLWILAIDLRFLVTASLRTL